MGYCGDEVGLQVVDFFFISDVTDKYDSTEADIGAFSFVILWIGVATALPVRRPDSSISEE